MSLVPEPFVSPPADARSPDESTCRWCGHPITWDDWCYVHDITGFADCGLTITDTGPPIEVDGVRISINPLLGGATGTRAEPIEWGPPDG